MGQHISLRDPDRHLDFDIVHGGTRDRLLTGADFDIESVVRVKDGSFWIGEEFGPFLLHVSRTGRLLQAPAPFPDGKSPANPYLGPGETPRVGSSRGFEAMGGSQDGRYLYPVVEGAFTDDRDQRRRWIYEFDIRRGAYTGRRWAYQTDQAADVIGDAFMTGRNRMLLIERDDFEGPKAVIKRVYEIDLRAKDREGFVEKELVLDALDVDNPDLIGAGGGYGTGEDWSLPVQSFETVLLLPGNRLLIGNDNNYPGSSARRPGTPDDTEMAIVKLRRTRVEPAEATLVAHRGASGYRPEHTLTANLRELDRRTPLPIVQLVDCSGAPYDLRAAGDPRTYADLVMSAGLRAIARYADGVGLCKNVMIPRNADNSLGQPTPVIRDAHRVGLDVHGWTFRLENQFLPSDFRSSADLNAPGDLAGEIRVFLDAGMDGFFTDQPDIGAQVTG